MVRTSSNPPNREDNTPISIVNKENYLATEHYARSEALKRKIRARSLKKRESEDATEEMEDATKEKAENHNIAMLRKIRDAGEADDGQLEDREIAQAGEKSAPQPFESLALRLERIEKYVSGLRALASKYQKERNRLKKEFFKSLRQEKARLKPFFSAVPILKKFIDPLDEIFDDDMISIDLSELLRDQPFPNTSNIVFGDQNLKKELDALRAMASREINEEAANISRERMQSDPNTLFPRIDLDALLITEEGEAGGVDEKDQRAIKQALSEYLKKEKLLHPIKRKRNELMKQFVEDARILAQAQGLSQEEYQEAISYFDFMDSAKVK